MPKEGIVFDYDLRANEHVKESQSCGVCETALALQWTDFHGVAICQTCHCPYRVYHFDDKENPNKRTSDIPTLDVREQDIPMLKRIWKATGNYKDFVSKANAEFEEVRENQKVTVPEIRLMAKSGGM